ncbi:MAG: YbjN domain-containing protein [Azospirillaceae bacterium]|nr:YbjN domain-containing protein [Azospirillaceae bacterium]
MSAVAVETTHATHNPLDLIEEIVTANEWPFDRSNDDEMIVEISGRWCDYRLYFVWQPEISAMQFSCQFDMKVQAGRRPAVNELLAEINAKMWLGHFDICLDEHTPMFRHTVLLRGARGASVEQMEDLVEIALSECERYYPAFQFVIWGGKTAAEAVTAAILDTVGEA